MTKTTNYQLNQWAKSDRVMMDDFNADNTKIDAALKANADTAAANTQTLATQAQTMWRPRSRWSRCICRRHTEMPTGCHAAASCGSVHCAPLPARKRASACARNSA